MSNKLVLSSPNESGGTPMQSPDRALDKITCPNCGELIPVSEAIYHQIAEQTRAESKAEILEIQRALAMKDRELKDRESNLDRTIEDRLNAAEAKLKAEAEIKAKEFTSLEMEDLRRQNAEKEEKLEAARRSELDWRRKQRELEEREKDVELEAIRRMDAERQRIAEDTAKRLEEGFRFRDAEKDKKLQDALKMNDELKRKLEQGSQQTQGEVFELQLEELLRSAFPADHIEPVPKGMNGADLVQRVLNRSGQLCGTIVWESKRTKNWSDGWLQKLKDDQRVLRAEMAVLVSEVMPKDCNNFMQLSGVWVSHISCAVSLAAVMRQYLLHLASTRAIAVGTAEKMEVLYRYVSSTEFRQRVEAVAETLIAMQKDLQEEKRVAERIWAKRDKQIERVIANTSGIYGDLQGLIGTSLQDIPVLTASALNETNDLGSSIALPVTKAENSREDDVPF
jgi:hypothetical protein